MGTKGKKTGKNYCFITTVFPCFSLFLSVFSSSAPWVRYLKEPFGIVPYVCETWVWGFFSSFVRGVLSHQRCGRRKNMEKPIKTVKNQFCFYLPRRHGEHRVFFPNPQIN